MTTAPTLRLLSAAELAGDPHPHACVEVVFTSIRREEDAAASPTALRITPADVIRLRMETELTLDEMRTEVMRAEIAWEKTLGSWYEEGRRAVEARAPDVALLARVLEGLCSGP
ncbi:hypothetical protein ACWGHM_29265 [Streptomyces sp. NPDC054904]